MLQFALLSALLVPTADEPKRLVLQKGDHVVLIGSTFAEREQYFARWETLVHSRFADLELVVRDIGWSADELTLRPRSKDYKDHGQTLEGNKADVVVACFGFNESFKGPKGLPKFEADLESFIRKTLAAKYNGKSAPRLALISPIAQEDLKNPNLTNGAANNENIAKYTEAMKRIAAKHGVPFVDLYTPSKALMAESPKPLTFNGIHLTDFGYQKIAPVWEEGLFGPRPTTIPGGDSLEKLRSEILEKNLQHYYDYRAVNGFYIYGGRKEPFGVVNFPAEFAKLRKMVENRDRRIWAVAQGKTVPDVIDDSNTGDFKKIVTNVPKPAKILSSADALKSFTLPKGYVIELFASEEQFPDLRKPCQMTFDAAGRLWVCTMPSYPMYLPGTPANDKVLILEDTDGDGKADKSTVFADKLHLPTGLAVGDGGAYVANQPNLLFLKDTDGDGKADQREMVLHGFDSADSHHAMHAFTWGPGGDIYFGEGTFHRSQVETPYGPQRLADAGFFRYEPRTQKFDIFVSYGFANPWGITFDKYGQTFVADASGGANYFGTAFSGAVDYPRKHGRMKEFLKMQWRPTCGCELVSSRNFPDEAQGNYLLNNDIGFQGVLQYKVREDGSGFWADPVEPLLKSSDPTFRPTSLEFGPDGCLYVCDWSNPLIGHMQHSVRDPNRDNSHGRIYRIRYTGKPLVKSPKLAGQSIPELLDALKTYEDRTRYRARIALRDFPTKDVVAGVEKWIASLDEKNADSQRLMLEALWVCQHHNHVEPKLLAKLLRSPDFRVRAGATRVLCYWRDQVEKPLDLLRTQVNDDNARVRLEAIRALSFFDSQAALDVAVESLALPQDPYLEYTLKETTDTLEGRIRAKK